MTPALLPSKPTKANRDSRDVSRLTKRYPPSLSYTALPSRYPRLRAPLVPQHGVMCGFSPAHAVDQNLSGRSTVMSEMNRIIA